MGCEYVCVFPAHPHCPMGCEYVCVFSVHPHVVQLGVFSAPGLSCLCSSSAIKHAAVAAICRPDVSHMLPHSVSHHALGWETTEVFVLLSCACICTCGRPWELADRAGHRTHVSHNTATHLQVLPAVTWHTRGLAFWCATVVLAILCVALSPPPPRGGLGWFWMSTMCWPVRMWWMVGYCVVSRDCHVCHMASFTQCRWEDSGGADTKWLQSRSKSSVCVLCEQLPWCCCFRDRGSCQQW